MAEAVVSNPTIPNYKPFYIQYGSNLTASDTNATWGLLAKSNPFPALPNPKAPYNNDWKGEDGDDEYNTSLKYEAFTFDVSFYIRTKGDNASAKIRTQLSTFFTAIKDGEFKIYDSYTALGRQKVRYAGFREESFRERRNTAVCIFSVSFKVNDPTTFMKLNNGAIVTV